VVGIDACADCVLVGDAEKVPMRSVAVGDVETDAE